jgi:hypothetical protein
MAIESTSCSLSIGRSSGTVGGAHRRLCQMPDYCGEDVPMLRQRGASGDGAL